MKLLNVTKSVILATALLIAAQAPALADQNTDKPQKPLTPEQSRRQQMDQLGFEVSPEAAGSNASAVSNLGNALEITAKGSGAYAGCKIGQTGRQRGPFTCAKEERIHLLVRRILGRDGSYLGVLMHPAKDHEKIALYRIDPISPGEYDMTRLSLTTSIIPVYGAAATPEATMIDTYVGVENIDPELKLMMPGDRILIGPANEKARRPGRQQAAFIEPMEFRPAALFRPVPDVAWTDLRAGSYRGLYFDPKSTPANELSVNGMDPAGICTSDEPCYESSANLILLKGQRFGQRKVFERLPGMFTFNSVETLRDGDHTGPVESIAVFLRVDGDEKIYLVDPMDAAKVDVLKKL